MGEVNEERNVGAEKWGLLRSGVRVSIMIREPLYQVLDIENVKVCRMRAFGETHVLAD